MYEFLHGHVEELRLGVVVLDVRDVGYCLVVSAPTSAALESGQEVKMLTHLAVSETSQVLFGFLHQAERALFRRLVQVNGIGPSSAIGLLSSLPPEDMVRAILDGDAKKLTAMKGVGKKTAERLIVELRDHLGDLLPSQMGGSPAAATPSNDDPVSSDLERVLLELGTPPAHASRGAQAAIDQLGTDADFQELLRYALSSNS